MTEIAKEFVLDEARSLALSDFDITQPIGITVTADKGEVSFSIGDEEYTTESSKKVLNNITVNSDSITFKDLGTAELVTVFVTGTKVEPEEVKEEIVEESNIEEVDEELVNEQPEVSNEEVEQIIESEDTSLVQEEVPTVENSGSEEEISEEPETETESPEDSEEEPVEEPKTEETPKMELAGIDITPVEQYHPVRIRRVTCNRRDIWCEGVDSSFLYTVSTKGGKKDDVIKLTFLINQPVKNVKLDGKPLTGDGATFDIEFKVVGYHISMNHQVMTSHEGHDDVVKIVISNEPSEISDAVIVS